MTMYTDEKFYARNDDMVIMPLRNINLIAELKFFCEVHREEILQKS